MQGEFPLSLHSRAVKRTALIIVVGLVVLYVLIPNLHAFGLSFKTALPKHYLDVILAYFAFLLTFICSSFNYKHLAFKKIRQRQILLVQMASVPLNLLLPAGIGNISINYLFLRTKKHSRAEAGLVVGVNNATGVVANLSLLILLLFVFGVNQNVLDVYTKHRNWLLLVLGIIVLGALITLWLLNSQVKKLKNARTHIVTALRSYTRRKRSLVIAYSFSLIQSAVTALAFWLCLRAYGIELSYPLSFLIYALSVLVGALIPTPGGLGGVEASLTASIVATHGASASLALAAVLAYRVVSYWLPMVVGFFALFLTEKLKLVRWKQ